MLLPIGRFAKLAGLSVAQLRHYDRRGILHPAARDRSSGYRYYSEAQAAAARVIALLRSIDVPLADVQELLAAPEPDRVRRVFAEHRRRVERRLEEARLALESIDRIIEEGTLMDAEERCSFCGKPMAQLAPGLAQPAGTATICGGCVVLAREVIETEVRMRSEGATEGRPSARRVPEGTPVPPAGWRSCAFCGRPSTDVRFLVAGPTMAICDGCVAA